MKLLLYFKMWYPKKIKILLYKKMSNVDGLLSAKIVAGTANIGESSYFVLNTDPVSVDILSANEVVANTIISGTVEVNTNIDLNGGILTVNGGVLEVNGTPVGGIPDDWSTYPAISAVDISGQDINKVELITGLPTNNKPIIINNTYNLGNLLTQHALLVAGGFDVVGSEVKPVALGIKKEAFYIGAGEQELANINFIGLDDVGEEEFYASINTYVSDNTKNAGDARMTFNIDVNGVVKNMLELDGSNNKILAGAVIDMSGFKITNLATPTDLSDAANKDYVDTIALADAALWSQFPALQTVDMSGFKLDNVATIDSQDISNANIIINTPEVLATGQPVSGNLLVVGGANRIDISNAGVNITTRKAISGGGNGETIGQYNFVGLTDLGGGRTYGQVATYADAIGSGGENGRMALSVRRVGGFVPYVVCDGSNNTVIMQRGITLGGDADKGIEECGFIGNTGTIDISASTAGADIRLLAADDIALNSADILLTAGTDITLTATDDIILNATDEVNITGDDINLDCTGLTSVLNITSAFGTLIAAGGAVDITAGGAVLVNAVGNISIGSTGTTSIENFNLTNSVLTKVPDTDDLELNDIASITNSAAQIDISSSLVNITGQLKATTATGGRANPTITLETTSDAAPGAYLQFYHNSATPAVNDRAGVLDMYANNASAGKYEVARIRTLQQTITAGTEDGSIEMWVIKDGTITQTMTIDGSNSKVSIVAAGVDITKDASNNAPHLQLIATNAGVSGITEHIFRDVALSANDVIYQKSYFGDSSTGVKEEFARDVITCRDPTNNAEDASLTTSLIRAGTLRQYMRTDALNNNIFYGLNAGLNVDASGGTVIIAIGSEAGQNALANTISIGDRAGQAGARANAISIGTQAGTTGMGIRAVAIGNSAGRTNLGENSVAVGYRASETGNGFGTVAIGDNAANTGQGNYGVALGTNAGQNNQAAGAFAFGIDAGQNTQGTVAIAIGGGAGRNSQGARCIAIGESAGISGQLTYGIAIGAESGRNTQGARAIAIGENAGNGTQGGNSVAIGRNAGQTTLGNQAIAIGYDAIISSASATTDAVAVGYEALRLDGRAGAIGIGRKANRGNAGENSIVIGAYSTDVSGSGTNSIAIGRNAVANTSTANSITLNGSGTAITANQAGLFVAPIRGVAHGLGVGVLKYDPTTKEITYSTD